MPCGLFEQIPEHHNGLTVMIPKCQHAGGYYYEGACTIHHSTTVLHMQ